MGASSPEATPQPSAAKTALPVVVFIATGPLVSICIRYLSQEGMEPVNQIAVRTASGGTVLAMLSIIRFRDETTALFGDIREFGCLFAAILLGLGGQYFVVRGLSLAPAAMAGVVGVTGIPLTVVLAAVFFHDERETARRPSFIIGAVVALAGALGAAFAKPGDMALTAGVAWLAAGTTVDAVRSQLLKRAMREVHPVPASAVICLVVAAVYTCIGLATGKTTRLSTLSPFALGLATASGVGGMLVGVLLHLVIFKRIGVSAFTVLRLCMPVTTALLAWILIGDELTVAQIGFGAVVIAGSAVSFVGRRRAAQALSNSADASENGSDDSS